MVQVVVDSQDVKGTEQRYWMSEADEVEHAKGWCQAAAAFQRSHSIILSGIWLVHNTSVGLRQWPAKKDCGGQQKSSTGTSSFNPDAPLTRDVSDHSKQYSTHPCELDPIAALSRRTSHTYWEKGADELGQCGCDSMRWRSCSPPLPHYYRRSDQLSKWR
ncbi:hypothetical protein BC629DRAFT_1446170 [Irpex lacteus]|nr:hypothetical protein BC629DRAFT_1446170 [Irpex lacteus]